MLKKIDFFSISFINTHLKLHPGERISVKSRQRFKKRTLKTNNFYLSYHFRSHLSRGFISLYITGTTKSVSIIELISPPMAIAVIGGLLSSMVLTLLIVPVIYRLINPIDRFLRRFYEVNKIS